MKLLGLAVIGIIVGACCPKAPEPPTPQSLCPTDGTPPSSKEQLDACLNGIVFDTSYEAGDFQALTIIDKAGVKGEPCPGDSTHTLRCRYGPRAKIEPVIGGQQYSDEDLMEGRIIAQITVPPGEKEGYEKYGLVAGATTYWWARTDSTGEKGQSFFITVKDGRILSKPKPRPLIREPYQEEYAKEGKVDKTRKYWRAIARWIWDLQDETAKVKCGSGSCS